MQCKIGVKKISKYVDDELCIKEKIEFENHLKSCIYCQKELNEIQTAWKKLEAIQSIKPNPWAFTRLQVALDKSTKIAPQSIWTRFLIPISSIAVACLGIWLGSLTWHHNNNINQNKDTYIAYYEETIENYASTSLSSVYFEMTTQENGDNNE